MPQMTKEQQVIHLKEWANGLDTAGSYESRYFEGWAQELEYDRMTISQVMDDIWRRYSGNNDDVVAHFEYMFADAVKECDKSVNLDP